MRALATLTAAVAIALATAGQPALAQGAAPTPAERGLQLAMQNCSGCHALGAEGRSPRAGAPPFRELDRRFSMETLEFELRAGMLTGHPPIPPFMFTQVQISDIMAYLRALQSARHTARAGL